MRLLKHGIKQAWCELQPSCTGLVNCSPHRAHVTSKVGATDFVADRGAIENTDIRFFVSAMGTTLVMDFGPGDIIADGRGDGIASCVDVS
jgi:hypothetical protein